MNKKRIEKERRKDLRVGISEPFLIRFRIVKKKGLPQVFPRRYATTSNISASGILVELPGLSSSQIERIIKNNDKLILELDTPYSKKPLKVKGKIVWLERKDRRGKLAHVSGIFFEDIKEEDREKLLLQLINLCLKGKAKIS